MDRRVLYVFLPWLAFKAPYLALPPGATYPDPRLVFPEIPRVSAYCPFFHPPSNEPCGPFSSKKVTPLPLASVHVFRSGLSLSLVPPNTGRCQAYLDAIPPVYLTSSFEGKEG